MAFRDLQSKLGQLSSPGSNLPDPLVLNAALIESDDITRLFDATLHTSAITVNEPHVSLNQNLIIVSGKASLLGVDRMLVEAVFEDGSGELKLRLTANLPDSWRFRDSFPGLAQNFNFNPDPEFYGYGESYLAGLTFSKPVFALTTHPCQDTGSVARFERGLNFRGLLSPSGLLEALGRATESEQALLLSGLIASDKPSTEFCLSAQIARLRVGDNDLSKLLQNFRLRLWSSLQSDHTAAAKMEICVELEIIKGKRVELYCPIGIGAPLNFLVVGARFSNFALPNLSDIAALVGGDDLKGSLEKLPEAPSSFGGLTINEVRVGVSSTQPEVTYVLVTVHTTSQWKIIEEIFEVDALIVSWLIDSPFHKETRSISCELDGRLSIAGVPIDVHMQWPECILSGALSEGSTIGLGDMLKHFIPAIPLPDDSLIISTLALRANPTSKRYEIYAQVDSLWSIPFGSATLSIDSLILSFFSTPEGFSGSLTGIMMLRLPKSEAVAEREMTLELSAALPDATASGWQFTGSTKKGHGIPVGTLVEKLATMLGGGCVPDAIRTLVFKNLELSFNTGQEKRFRFGGAATLDVDGRLLDITLAVKAERENETYQLTFEGEVEIGGARFKFVLASGAPGQEIVAQWSNEDKGITLSEVVIDLASKMGISDVAAIPESLDATLTSLSLYIHSGMNDLVLSAETQSGSKIVIAIVQSGGNKKYAILIDKKLHLGLSSLPLVGDKIVEVSSKIAGVEDVGIESLQAVFTYGVGGNETDHKQDIDKFNETIKAVAARLNTGNLPCLPETRQVKVQSRNAQVHLNVTYFFADKPQPPVEFPFDDAPNKVDSTSQSGAATGQEPAGVQSKAVWLDVQRSFGPVSVKRLGIACVNGQVRFLLDASLVASGLTMGLQGLSLGFPIVAITKFKRKEFLEYLGRNVQQMSTNLAGLSVIYENGPMAISGGLLKVDSHPENTNYAYNGELLLKADTWALSVVGSFAQMKSGESSLFAYGILNATLGGPAFFFVTGIAAGFGYNRSLRLPTLNDLPGFPLMAAITTGNRDQLTKEIDKYVYPASGQNWLAAGVRFTSFKVIDSFALLTVFFGERFEIGLLGLSTITVPARSKKAAIEPIAYAQLALAATYAPDDGVLKIAAQLMPGSYILSDKCRLTGGFALYTWFQDEFEKDNKGNIVRESGTQVNKLVKGGFRSGDFLLSIGGYHPDFKPPAHYPSVPRVGANWRVNENLTIKGSLYFALTPLAIMAGGSLEANYEHGNLKAWFNSRVDFLLYWEPLNYQANLNVNMGASYTMAWWSTTKTIAAQVAANVELYGPPFGGKAAVDLYVCSFTIDFGDEPQPPKKLDWEQFEGRFLPGHSEVCLSRVAGGLIKELPARNTGEGPSWVVNAGSFVIVTSSAIPCSSLPLVNDETLTDKNGESIKPFGVKPRETLNGHLQSQQIIKFRDKDGNNADCTWEIVLVTQRLPRAAWDASELPSGSNQDRERQRKQILDDLAKDQVTDELTTGFRVTPKPRKGASARAENLINLSQLPMSARDIPIPDKSWENPNISRINKYDNSGESIRYSVLSKIEDPETKMMRGNISAALKRQKIDLTAQPDTHYFARVAETKELLSAPFICDLGEMHPL